MKINKVIIKGGSCEFCIASVSERIVASLSILLLGKMWGALGVATLRDVEIVPIFEMKSEK